MRASISRCQVFTCFVSVAVSLKRAIRLTLNYWPLFQQGFKLYFRVFFFNKSWRVQVVTVDENGNKSNPALSRKWARCSSLSWESLLAVELPLAKDFSEAAFLRGLIRD